MLAAQSLPGWHLEFILIGFWVLIGIMAFMIHTNRQERKRQKQHDAEKALARELDEFRERHADETPIDKPESPGNEPKP